MAEIITTGSDCPGVILSDCPRELDLAFDQADLILSKGQGNYESLSEVPGKTRAFLTKVKCPVIARDMGHPVGSSVIQIVHSNQK